MARWFRPPATSRFLSATDKISCATRQLRDSLIPKYSTLVYDGFWFAPEREALQALVTETQRDVTGVVRFKLYKGNIIIARPQKPEKFIRSADCDDGNFTQDRPSIAQFCRRVSPRRSS